MVNTGKPSPGCFACRNRRIKCDTTRPECRKCRKRGWKCPGYRDLNALRIVDETQKQFTRFQGDKEHRDHDDEPTAAAESSRTAVIRQYAPPGAAADRRTPRRVRGGPPSSSSSLASASSPSSYPSPVSPVSPTSPTSTSSVTSPPNIYRYYYANDADVPRCINPPIGDSVYNYFVQNFVQGSSLRNHGYLDFLFPLLANQSQSQGPGGGQRDNNNNALPMAFAATAMIAFAARQKALDLIPKAESVYLRALEATVTAIGDPDRARDNSTLACVTLLTTFEVFHRPDMTTLKKQLRPSRPSHQKAEAFGSHLDGAVALMKMRGKELFQTIVGRKLFLMLRSLLASRSLCYGTPLDPELYRLTDELEQEATQRRFGELSLRAADLRVAVERLLGGWSPAHRPSGALPTPEAVAALLRAADALEADYDAHVRSLPLTWRGMTLRYMSASSSPPDPTVMRGIAYEGRVDAYVDMFICYILNWARAARLYVRYCALRCHAWLLGPERDYRDTPEYARAAALGATLIEDTVASVPYVFGAVRLGGDAVQSSSPGGAQYQPPSLAGVFCMWPVFAAASSDFATETQRVFLKKTLKFIAEEIGIGQAAILAGYNLRNPSMPIAFTKMKQFEAQGKQLQGVAAGAAAGSVMTAATRDLIRTTGSVMTSPPDYHPRTLPMHVLKTEPMEDEDEFLRFRVH